MKYANRDPYWLSARFAGACAKTGRPFAKGDRIFYYPSERKAYAHEAAEQAARDFEAAMQDERFLETQSGGLY